MLNIVQKALRKAPYFSLRQYDPDQVQRVTAAVCGVSARHGLPQEQSVKLKWPMRRCQSQAPVRRPDARRASVLWCAS